MLGGIFDQNKIREKIEIFDKHSSTIFCSFASSYNAKAYLCDISPEKVLYSNNSIKEYVKIISNIIIPKISANLLIVKLINKLAVFLISIYEST